MSISHGELNLEPEDLYNDLKRELSFYEFATENTKKALRKLNSLSIPVWRPNDYKAEMFKSEQQMSKLQEHLSQIKNKIEVVDQRKQAKNRKKFAEAAHKKHVKSRQMKVAEKKSAVHRSKKARPGKWRRQRKKSKGNN